uniref:Secreted protein n=1 Tax=Picea glauca TaxID=3330 RepID=A0A101LWI5_PICGL|nr:hypothetical protein ABT39_MTgene1326 [Picea glauca]QHR89520.1 hypothetical protein Q903MT_gene3542 [Picea sitchensis]
MQTCSLSPLGASFLLNAWALSIQCILFDTVEIESLRTGTSNQHMHETGPLSWPGHISNALFAPFFRYLYAMGSLKTRTCDTCSNVSKMGLKC